MLKVVVITKEDSFLKIQIEALKLQKTQFDVNFMIGKKAVEHLGTMIYDILLLDFDAINTFVERKEITRIVTSCREHHQKTQIAVISECSDFEAVRFAINNSIDNHLFGREQMSKKGIVDVFKRAKAKMVEFEKEKAGINYLPQLAKRTVEEMAKRYELCKEISLEILAKELNVTKWHLSKVINNDLKMSFSNLLRVVKNVGQANKNSDGLKFRRDSFTLA